MMGRNRPYFIQLRKPSEPKRRRHSPRYSPIKLMMPSRTWKSRCCSTEYCAAVINVSDKSCAAASIDIIVIQGRRQLGARQCRVRSQFHYRWFVLKRRILIEELIDPNRQRKSGSIKRVLFKCVGHRRYLISVEGIILGRVASSKERVDFRAPIFCIKQMRPAHFAGDNLIASRIVEIRFQQLHVLLGLMILLLEKTLPVILVPHLFGLAVVVGHVRLNVSFCSHAKVFRHSARIVSRSSLTES